MSRLDRRSVVVALLAAAPLSQLGHQLAYLLHYGQAAGAQQGSGVHAYFPSLLQAGATALGAALLAGLLVVALARLMIGIRNDRVPSGGVPVLPLLLLLLGVQLAVYCGQELLEFRLAGLTAPASGLILGWGLAGQLPVAALAALGLSWLTAGVVRAVQRLRVSRPVAVLPRQEQSLPPAWRPNAAPTLVQAAPAALRKRGPPNPSFP